MFFQLLIPWLTPTSLLESNSGSAIVKQLADTGNRRSSHLECMRWTGIVLLYNYEKITLNKRLPSTSLTFLFILLSTTDDPGKLIKLPELIKEVRGGGWERWRGKKRAEITRSKVIVPAWWWRNCTCSASRRWTETWPNPGGCRSWRTSLWKVSRPPCWASSVRTLHK